MPRYIRFQTSVCCPRTRRQLGVFQALNVLERDRPLDWPDAEPLYDAVGWYNVHLRVPRLTSRDDDCVFWFLTDRQFTIRRVWDVVLVMRHNGLQVRKLLCDDPGAIVYRDEDQVAARPNRRVRQMLQA